MGNLSQKVGSAFESEVERMFRRIPGCKFVINWNDRATAQARKGKKKVHQDKKPADIQACFDGFSVLCECKTVKVPRLGFSVIADKRYYTEEDGNPQNNQRNTLLKHTLSGGLSLIAIKMRSTGKDPRYWLLSFQHWEAIRRRLWPNRKSIPLTDKERPMELTEIGRSSFSEISSSLPLYDQELKDTVLAIYESAKSTPLVDYRFH